MNQQETGREIRRQLGIGEDEYPATARAGQTIALNRSEETDTDKINRLMGTGQRRGTALNMEGAGRLAEQIKGLDPLEFAEAKNNVVKMMKLSPSEVARREADALRVDSATSPLTQEEVAACWALGINPMAYSSAKREAAGLDPIFIEE